MAKPSVKSWSDARLLFESGKSLGEISNATGLDKGNISKKAKSEGWQKAVLQPLVASMTRDAAEFTTLLQPQQQLVVKQVEKNLRYMGLRDDVIDIAFTRIKKDLKECDTQLIKPLIEAADKTCVMAEIAPRFNPNSGTVINNNQQNNYAAMSLDDIEREIKSIEQRRAAIN